MTHQVDMIMDLQYGSTGKGLIAGYMAKRQNYDTVVCSFATNAGHTYVDKERGMHVMTQQLPTGALASRTVKHVLIGPGALVHAKTLEHEITKYAQYLAGKQVMIHPHAAIVEDYHAQTELDMGMSKIGSTTKGVGAAMIERIHRNTDSPNIAKNRLTGPLAKLVVTAEQYREVMQDSENVLVEGAQGFGLSMYHGFYPFTTSRDVTPWQIAADCGLPFKWASYIRVIGTMRTYPIRVNNRDGSSGPCYRDQRELDWEKDFQGVAPELTTVTKLKRRIFTFSQQQAIEAAWHCGGYWDTRIFLNFVNYCANKEEIETIINAIEEHTSLNMNPPRVNWLGWGADDANVDAYFGEFL